MAHFHPDGACVVAVDDTGREWRLPLRLASLVTRAG